MPTTSSPLASDVLVNSLIKMEQQSSIAGAGDPILHFPPALQISPAGAMQALSAQPSSSVAASVPHLLLSQQQPVLPPPSLPTVEAVAGAVAAAAAASGTGDEDCKVKLEIDDLFPSVPSWDETGPTVSASAAAIASTAAPPAFLTVTMPSLSTTNAATSTVVKTVRIPSLQHSISVPAGDVEAALKLPQVPATSSSSSASALNLNALRPQAQHPVPSAALASAGLRIAIPQSADTTTSAVGGMAPPTTPSPAGSSSIASPPMAGAAIATAASASSTTKKTVFTAKGKDRELGKGGPRRLL